MAKPKQSDPEPFDNPYIKARNRAPGAVVTVPRNRGHVDAGGVVSKKPFDAFVSRMVAEGRTKGRK